MQRFQKAANHSYNRRRTGDVQARRNIRIVQREGSAALLPQAGDLDVVVARDRFLAEQNLEVRPHDRNLAFVLTGVFVGDVDYFPNKPDRPRL